ncbi:Tetraspanin-6 [Varanus komodoensis]|nr:Tetraspanin-6 [Varanus komodoensis]
MMGKEVANWESFVKISLWLAILLYWISGIVLTCIGVSIQVKLHDTFTVLDDAASGVPVIITVVGMLIILVSTIGAVALLKCNPKMIKWFIGLLLIQLIIEIALGMAACTYREKVHQTLLKDVLKTLEKYNGELQITKGVDSLQTQGCVLKLKNWVEEHITIFGGIAMFVGLAQLTGILFCYLLLKLLKENYTSIE